MIVVTGGAGFIGSNLVKSLNSRGRRDIVVVDNLKNGVKFKNLADCEISDYWDKDDFLAALTDHPEKLPSPVTAVIHLGACSSTTEWDGRYLMHNNYTYSKHLLHYCLGLEIPYLYASSASVYGSGTVFRERLEYEQPLNMYGYTKFLFDQYVRQIFSTVTSQVAGFRYFNVYGPREGHKANMASVAFHLNNQILQGGSCPTVRLFEGSDGYPPGGQRRDFIYVEDAVDVTLWFLDHPEVSGIFNVGTGRAQTFNEVAQAVIQWHGKGEIEYIPFPDHLKGRYQSYTEADVSQLRRVGYQQAFKSVEEGIARYLDWLNRK